MRKRQVADGDICPVRADHGRMLMLPSKRQYCPDQDHDRTRTPNVYAYDGVTPIRKEA